MAGKKPKSIEDMTGESDQDKKNIDSGGEGNDKIGSKQKTNLLAIYASDNENIWKHLDIQFKSQEKNSSGFFAITETEHTIKDLCAKAYKENDVGTQNDKPKEDDLYKWCSLKGKKTTTSA